MAWHAIGASPLGTDPGFGAQPRRHGSHSRQSSAPKAGMHIASMKTCTRALAPQRQHMVSANDGGYQPGFGPCGSRRLVQAQLV